MFMSWLISTAGIFIVCFFIDSSFIQDNGGNGKRIGAVCNEGWRSYSTGSGACSHHGGVDYWIYD